MRVHEVSRSFKRDDAIYAAVRMESFVHHLRLKKKMGGDFSIMFNIVNAFDFKLLSIDFAAVLNQAANTINFMIEHSYHLGSSLISFAMDLHDLEKYLTSNRDNTCLNGKLLFLFDSIVIMHDCLVVNQKMKQKDGINYMRCLLSELYTSHCSRGKEEDLASGSSLLENRYYDLPEIICMRDGAVCSCKKKFLLFKAIHGWTDVECVWEKESCSCVTNALLFEKEKTAAELEHTIENSKKQNSDASPKEKKSFIPVKQKAICPERQEKVKCEEGTVVDLNALDAASPSSKAASKRDLSFKKTGGMMTKSEKNNSTNTLSRIRSSFSDIRKSMNVSFFKKRGNQGSKRYATATQTNIANEQQVVITSDGQSCVESHVMTTKAGDTFFMNKIAANAKQEISGSLKVHDFCIEEENSWRKIEDSSMPKKDELLLQDSAGLSFHVDEFEEADASTHLDCIATQEADSSRVKINPSLRGEMIALDADEMPKVANCSVSEDAKSYLSSATSSESLKSVLSCKTLIR